MAARKKKSKKSPVRRSVKPKMVKSSRSKTIRLARPAKSKRSGELHIFLAVTTIRLSI